MSISWTFIANNNNAKENNNKKEQVFFALQQRVKQNMFVNFIFHTYWLEFCLYERNFNFACEKKLIIFTTSTTVFRINKTVYRPITRSQSPNEREIWQSRMKLPWKSIGCCAVQWYMRQKSIINILNIIIFFLTNKKNVKRDGESERRKKLQMCTPSIVIVALSSAASSSSSHSQWNVYNDFCVTSLGTIKIINR